MVWSVCAEPDGAAVVGNVGTVVGATEQMVGVPELAELASLRTTTVLASKS